MPRSRVRPSKQAKARGRELALRHNSNRRSAKAKGSEEDPDYVPKGHGQGDDRDEDESGSQMTYEAIAGSVDPDLASAWVEDGSFPFLDSTTTENNIPEEYDMSFSSTFENPEDPLLNLEGTETVKIEGGASWNMQSDNFWACDTCNEEFQDYESLVQHISGNMCSEIALDSSVGVEFMEQSCDPSMLSEEPDYSYKSLSEQYPDFNLKQPRLCLIRLDTYVCSTCNKPFLDKAVYLEHISTAHVDTTNSDPPPQTSKQRKLKCSYCPRLYRKQITRRIHERICPSANHEISFECWVCGAGFVSAEEMKKHIRNHFKCTRCPATFLQQSHLIKHSSTHVGPTPFPCHAMACGKRFTTSTSLYNHHAQDHPEEPFYWVSSEERAANLETEIPAVESTTSSVRAYAPPANKNSNNEANLKEKWHQAVHQVASSSSFQASSSPFQASSSSLQASSSSPFQASSSSPFQASSSSSFRTSSSPFQASSSSSSSFQASSSSSKVSSGPLFTSMYTCRHCPASFSKREGLEKHMLKMNTNRFKCDPCNIRFCSKYSLKRHGVVVHDTSNCGDLILDQQTVENLRNGKFAIDTAQGEDDLRWACEVCNCTFTTNYSKERHELTAHGKRKTVEYEPRQNLYNGIEKEEVLSGSGHPCTQRGEDGSGTGSGTGTPGLDLDGESRSLDDEASGDSTNSTGLDNLKCRFCEKAAFYSKFSRKRHESVVHGVTRDDSPNYSNGNLKRKECHICSTEFSSTKQLSNHMRAHTGARKFPCLTCEASFKLKYKLQQHYITYPLHKQIECPDCWYPFLCRNEFEKHRNTRACITQEPPLITLD